MCTVLILVHLNTVYDTDDLQHRYYRYYRVTVVVVTLSDHASDACVWVPAALEQ